VSSVVPSAAAAAPQGWLFEPVGDPAGNAFRPTDWTRGPWNPEFLHGCPVGALFAHLAEREKPSAEFLPARLTIDLYSAVPCTPLTGRSAVVKSSSRLRVIDIELLAGATAMARATVLFLRRTSDESPVATVADPMRFGPDEAIPVPWVDRDPGGPSRFYYEVEVRRVTEGDAGLPYQIWAS
jgi:hypothetical protein